ncbi:MAG TPA: protein kinase, partial [Candidatus Acidoferrum sp.]|nr:protein kinase [Candidatus Acidoferrum sp.]
MSSQGAGPSERRVGRYHLAEGLGGGPTGEVFRAKVYGVAGLERQFAVKRFHPELVSNPDRAALLAHAARVYGGLQHPRIARLHEFGVAGGETFAACELVRGIDLVRLLALAGERGGGLQPGAGAALIAAAARAIGFAHVRGLSHLGVCPSNVICTADGDVKVTDFGYLGLRLPVRPADDPGLVSRIRYLAPEQLRGEPGSLATDVFQLGLLACELLTGKAPLAGVDPHDLQRRAQAGELPVVALDLPRPLTQVIRRALAISPRERFADAGALADSLDAATRAAPLAGDRREVAALVRSAVEQPLASPGSERAASGAPLVPSPAASRATLTGRPPSMQRPARVESPSSNGDRGRSQQPAGGLQAGQVIMLPRPAVVPASVGDAARSAAESR